MKKTNIASLWRKMVLCFVAGCLVASSLKAQKNPASKYIQEHSNLAMRLMQQSGIPASVILGVAMVESSLGRSKSSKVLNNHFGIIGKNDKTATGYKSPYRQFEDVEASYENFVHIVTSKSFYENMKGSLDFSKWLTNLNKAGYCATNQYVWKRDIMYFINKYDLDRYDKLASWPSHIDLLGILSR